MYRYRNKSGGRFSFYSGILLIIWAVIIQLNSNFNIGYVLMIILGLLLVVYGKIKVRLPVPIRFFIVALSFLAFCAMLFLFVYGKRDTVTFREDALIVLGAGLRGEKPSRNLKSRLDTAVIYLEKNPTASVIVSGGKGEDETISEATAMRLYLVERGIGESRIFVEDRARSTAENFLYSKEILDQFFGEDCAVAYVTSDYHMYRADFLAKKAGLKAARYGAPLVWYLYPPAYLRELLACIHTIFIKK
ncbi:MAG: YdcF family protein [Fusobacteriaceae bacterium]|nr:YdcF family protein [Fusobacteriaceae bacterium]